MKKRSNYIQTQHVFAENNTIYLKKINQNSADIKSEEPHGT